MAYSLMSNKKNRDVTIHCSAANVSLTIAGNTSTGNVATSDEVLTAGVINKVVWGLDTGSIQILRGSNLVATFSQSGSIDYAALGMPITKDSTGTLVVNFIGTANGYSVISLKKVGAGSSDYLKN